MLEDEIKQGEIIHLEAEPLDADGNPVVIGTGWSAAFGVSRVTNGGQRVLTGEMAIADGKATGELDTDTLFVGDYFYDIRFTSPEGENYFSDPVHLAVGPRNAKTAQEP